MRDNYVRDFDATVQDVGANYVVLDRTAFYPEGGGQLGDRGVLSSGDTKAIVMDTKRMGGTIQHIIEGQNPFRAGLPVHGSLDWDWRHQNMRYHTAQHVLSRFLQLNYALETVGNQVKPGETRADFHPLADVSEKMKSETESGVNELLSKHLPVLLKFMPRAEAIEYLQKRGYQVRYLDMVPKSVTEFRVVLIGDWDASSCAGTHVANTCEIGRLKVLKTKNVGASKQRIYFTLLDS